jgi:hypothetical protein
VVAELIDRLRGAGGPQAARQPAGPPRPLAPPAPAWKPNASAGKDSGTAATPDPAKPDLAKPDPARLDAAKPTEAQDGDGANTDTRQQAGGPSTADKIKSALPPDMKTDSTADAVIDLVGGVLDVVAKRRAERQAAEAANPEQSQPPRRGRLLRRLVQPPASRATPVPADATPPLQPVPPQPVPPQPAAPQPAG